MKRTLSLLVATTALTAAIGLPAFSAVNMPNHPQPQLFAAILIDESQTLPLVLASDDDDHDDEDDDNDDHDDDDRDDDDRDDDRGGARNAAPAGTVAPPQNGLFGNGTVPKVQLN